MRIYKDTVKMETGSIGLLFPLKCLELWRNERNSGSLRIPEEQSDGEQNWSYQSGSLGTAIAAGVSESRIRNSFQDQPVSNAGLGKEMLWLSRIGFEFLSQMPHIDAEIMIALKITRPPHLFQ